MSASSEAKRSQAHERLMVTLSDAKGAGTPAPCTNEQRGHIWLSDEAHLIEDAVRSCATCPALDACRTYVTNHPEPAGVWAGIRPPSPGHSRATRARRADPP